MLDQTLRVQVSRFAFAGACAIVLSAALTGCYQKVVGAHGFGADSIAVQPSADDERVLGFPKSEYKPLPTSH